MRKKTAEIASIEQPEVNRIYLGNALSLLQSWPDNFIDCSVSSPPFYGLRDYKTPPQIWDGKPDCKHKWGDLIPNTSMDRRDPETKKVQGGQVGNNIKTEKHKPSNHGLFCVKCDAWLGELGQEPHFRDYIRHLTQIYTEIYRCLKPSGTCWVNLGDSFAGSGKGIGTKDGTHGKSVFTDDHIRKTNWKNIDVKAKCLMNIPGRFAIAMTDDVGFIQRNELIWHKPSAMPSSAKDRFTVDFEPIFFFTKTQKYWFEQQLEPVKQISLDRVKSRWKSKHDSIGEIDVDVMGSRIANPLGRNMRTVWTVNFEPSQNEHYASYPTRLLDVPIKAGCPEGGIVFDPFMGTGSTAIAAIKLGRQFLGCELQPDYHNILSERLALELEKGRLW